MLVFKVLLLKNIVWVLRLFRRKSGTALPGLLAEKYAPELFEHFARQINRVILITGTNGKTTTRNLLSSILNKAGIEHLSNKEGSNMKRGLLSTFLKNSSISGKLKQKTAIFEVEEATLPRIIEYLRPEILIVTNLFRDQLDAYGEVNTTQGYIKEAIAQSPQSRLILNADDPLVRELGIDKKEEMVSYYSIESSARKKFNYEGDESKIGQIAQAIVAKDIEITKDLHTRFQINLINYELKIPGIFHVYNAVAAIIAAKQMNVSQKAVQDAFKSFKPAFGRGEELKFGDLNFKILLIKNPAGFSLTLDMLSNVENPSILLILNDRIADGRDVSWIWDAEVEKLAKIKPGNVFISGTRADDMALRVRYCENLEKKKIRTVIEKDLKKMVEIIQNEIEKGETVFVLPTYTSMNEFRKVLGKKF
ncbi:DUF1727 domain-containing protein [Candidatus Dojkabacteria bacterium]|nr:DUF1727 domain-containing protein [Candidatus Dojkabacteria bacterium]